MEEGSRYQGHRVSETVQEPYVTKYLNIQKINRVAPKNSPNHAQRPINLQKDQEKNTRLNLDQKRRHNVILDEINIEKNLAYTNENPVVNHIKANTIYPIYPSLTMSRPSSIHILEPVRKTVLALLKFILWHFFLFPLLACIIFINHIDISLLSLLSNVFSRSMNDQKMVLKMGKIFVFSTLAIILISLLMYSEKSYSGPTNADTTHLSHEILHLRDKYDQELKQTKLSLEKKLSEITNTQKKLELQSNDISTLRGNLHDFEKKMDSRTTKLEKSFVTMNQDLQGLIISIVEEQQKKFEESLPSTLKYDILMDLAKEFVTLSSFEQYLSKKVDKKDLHEFIQNSVMNLLATSTVENSRPDFALASAGGKVIFPLTRAEKSFRLTSPYKRIFSYIFDDGSVKLRSPSVVLEPSLMPGDCWAFSGSRGNFTVRLAQPIIPDGFSLSHTPKEIALNINSAPREVFVYGLSFSSNEQEVFLGKYTYDINGSPNQYFPAINPDKKVFGCIKLSVNSNYGHGFTCLYRFQVHGKPKEIDSVYNFY